MRCFLILTLLLRKLFFTSYLHYQYARVIQTPLLYNIVKRVLQGYALFLLNPLSWGVLFMGHRQTE